MREVVKSCERTLTARPTGTGLGWLHCLCVHPIRPLVTDSVFTAHTHIQTNTQLMVVLMLTYQPLFIGGIDDLGRAKANAYGALFSFVVAFGISVLYLIQDRLSGTTSSTLHTNNGRRRRGDDYEGVPTNNNVLNDYAQSLDLPRSVQEGIFS